MKRALRLLCIDDSDEDVELEVRELERSGFEVTHRRVDTEAALSDALDAPWDLALSDFQMPGFGGMQAFHVLNRRKPDLPLVFVSGVMGEEMAVEAMRAGAKDYVLKQNLGRLGAVVHRELGEAENRRSREALAATVRHNDRRYRTIFDAASAALIELDCSAATEILEEFGRAAPGSPERSVLAARAAGVIRVTAVNAAAAKLVGAKGADELLEPIAPRVAGPRAGPWEEVLTAVLTERRCGPIRTEISFEALDGRKRDVLVTTRWDPEDADGRCIVLSVTDLTERNSLEFQMRAAQRMEAVGRLAGGIAHDFNNMLTVIGSYASFVLDHRKDDPLVQKDLRIVMDAADRAAALTRQLLAFSRQQVADIQVLCINRIVVDTEKWCERLLGEDVTVKTELAEDLGLAALDPAHVEQILVNLMVNARDAMPRGGTLTLATSNVTLDDSYSENKPAKITPGEYVRLAVTDDGEGMSAETRERIFEPFFTTKPVGQGTGLGLSTVYGIVKQAGGFVWVYSEPGQGTTFSVYLPRHHAEEAAQKIPSNPPSSGPRCSETVLLVEDEANVRRATERILKKAGYRVLTARDGLEALATCEARGGDIALVLTDVVMPRMDGPTLARRLRELFPETPVVFMSGYAGESFTGRDVLDLGARFVQKPFGRAALLATLREVLDAP